jgi:hypothetical protein
VKVKVELSPETNTCVLDTAKEPVYFAASAEIFTDLALVDNNVAIKRGSSASMKDGSDVG